MFLRILCEKKQDKFIVFAQVLCFMKNLKYFKIKKAKFSLVLIIFLNHQTLNNPKHGFKIYQNWVEHFWKFFNYPVKSIFSLRWA